MSKSKKNIIPGFGLSMGYTVFYLSLIVLIPVSTLVFNSFGLGPSKFWSVISAPRVAMSYYLSFYTAFLSALFNMVIGFIVAWALVRYRFPCRRFFDSIVDLPFALPTAVAGISLTTLLSQNGWIGSWLHKFNIHLVNNPAGIIIALIFVGFPFVVRTVQPVLQELEPEIEEAALSLGANRWQIFYRVILPNIFPALLTGATLSFSRAIGEYGSVIFISGNIPYKTEITPLLIMSKLDQFQYGQAAAVATTLMFISFSMVFALNMVQWKLAKKYTK